MKIWVFMQVYIFVIIGVPSSSSSSSPDFPSFFDPEEEDTSLGSSDSSSPEQEETKTSGGRFPFNPTRIVEAGFLRLYEQRICSAVQDAKAYGHVVAKDVKGMMRTGIKELGIPPLEPLYVPAFPFHIKQKHYDVKGNFRDVTIHNLSSFTLKKVDTDLPRRVRFTSVVTLPVITMNGNYQLYGMILHIFPVFGQGPFHVKYLNVTQAFTVEAAIDKTEGNVSVKDVDFAVTVKRIEVDLKGFMGRENIPPFALRMLDAMSLHLFHHFEPTITKEIARLLKKQINEVIKDFRAPFILRKRTSVLRKVKCR